MAGSPYVILMCIAMVARSVIAAAAQHVPKTSTADLPLSSSLTRSHLAPHTTGMHETGHTWWGVRIGIGSILSCAAAHTESSLRCLGGMGGAAALPARSSVCLACKIRRLFFISFLLVPPPPSCTSFRTQTRNRACLLGPLLTGDLPLRKLVKLPPQQPLLWLVPSASRPRGAHSAKSSAQRASLL